MERASLQVRIRTGVAQGLLIATYFFCGSIIPLLIILLFVRIPWWQRGLILVATVVGQYTLGVFGGLVSAVMRAFLAGYPLFLTIGAFLFAVVSYGFRLLFGLPAFSRGAPISGTPTTPVDVSTTIAIGALIGAGVGSLLWLMSRNRAGGVARW